MSETLLMSGLAVVVGMLGWILPYRWNPFRPKRFVEHFIPERFRPAVPKVISSLILLAGLVMLAGTLFLSTFASPDPRGVPLSVENESGSSIEVAFEFPGGETEETVVATDGTAEIFVKPASTGEITMVYAMNEAAPKRARIPIDVGPASVGGIRVTVTETGAVKASDGLLRH